MFQVLKFNISQSHPDYHIAVEQCSNSRIVRNAVNAVMRARFFHNSGNKDNSIYIIPKEYGIDVAKELKFSYSSMWSNVGRAILPQLGLSNFGTKIAQQTVRELSQSWSSFFAVNKAFKQGKCSKPSIPHYTKNFSPVVFNSQMIGRRELKNNVVKPTGWVKGFRLPPHVSGKQVKSARLIPQSRQHLVLEVIYKDEVNSGPTGDVTAGIDIGINNLFTIAFDNFQEGIIVSGKPIKRVNNHYNHLIDKHKSKVMNQRNNFHDNVNKGKDKCDSDYIEIPQFTSHLIDSFQRNRKLKIYHYYTTVTSAVSDALHRAGVNRVVIGYNKGIKQKSKMGKRNTRKFQEIPLKRIVDNLTWKLEKLGIEVILTEESYTSQSSFIDNDVLPIYQQGVKNSTSFSGKRQHRGLYITKNGGRINADLNGAFNIIRKNDSQFTSKISGDQVSGDAVVYPVRTMPIVGYPH